MQRFKCVIFDIDGLICNTEPLHQRAFNIVMEAVGADHVFDAEEYGRIMTGRSVAENAEYARERFALAADAADLAAAHRAIFNVLISDAENVEAMPGLDDLLNFLFAQDVKMAVASSSVSEHVEKMLRAVNLATTFDIIVSGSGDIKPKPAPDIYLKALQETQSAPAETVAIEDSGSGIAAARAAGLFAIAVKNDYTRHHDLSNADLVTDNLTEVRDYLSRSG